MTNRAEGASPESTIWRRTSYASIEIYSRAFFSAEMAGGTILTCQILPRIGLATLSGGVGWAHLSGVGCMAGICHTTSLFIAGLTDGPGGLLDQAGAGILGAAVIADPGGRLMRSSTAKPAMS